MLRRVLHDEYIHISVFIFRDNNMNSLNKKSDMKRHTGSDKEKRRGSLMMRIVKVWCDKRCESVSIRLPYAVACIRGFRRRTKTTSKTF